MDTILRTQSVITCVMCGHAEQFTMPRYAVRTLYRCGGCGTVYTTGRGECCIYCSYGSTPCPSAQLLLRSGDHANERRAGDAGIQFG
jgi:hypothetical protein